MIKKFLDGDDSQPDDPDSKGQARPDIIGLFDSETAERSDAVPDEEYVLSTGEPESYAETVRRSGLAWSAGVVFFASITFMLILGWGADLLFGSSPWGKVGGIILGSVIGFVQFFRLTSQIFKK